MPPGSAGVPPAQCRGTASAISATRIDPERRRGSLSVWPLRFTPTGWLPAKPRGSSATTISNRMRAGRPRSQGDLLPLMGWGDGRVGAGDRCFFYEHRCTGCTGFFQETASLYSWESAFPHRTIARAGFRCNNLSSCLSCASCASMLIIRLVATRAVEAAPSRFVALRVLLIVTCGTPRLPPSGSPAGSALSPTPPQGGSDS